MIFVSFFFLENCYLFIYESAYTDYRQLWAVQPKKKWMISYDKRVVFPNSFDFRSSGPNSWPPIEWIVVYQFPKLHSIRDKIAIDFALFFFFIFFLFGFFLPNYIVTSFNWFVMIFLIVKYHCIQIMCGVVYYEPASVCTIIYYI